MVTSMLFDTRHTVPSAVAKDIWIEKLNKIDKVFDSIHPGPPLKWLGIRLLDRSKTKTTRTVKDNRCRRKN